MPFSFYSQNVKQSTRLSSLRGAQSGAPSSRSSRRKVCAQLTPSRVAAFNARAPAMCFFSKSAP